MTQEPQQQKRRNRGQVVVEIIIAIAVLSILSAALSTMIVATQSNQENARRRDVAAGLVAESFTAVRTIAESDDTVSQGFNRLYCPPSGTCPGSGKGTGAHYATKIISGIWGLAAGAGAGGSDETISLSNITYTRYVTFENVCRDSAGLIVGVTDSNGSATTCTPSSNVEDPGTQRVTVTVSASKMSNLVVSQYISRWRNVVSSQTDWSGGVE